MISGLNEFRILDLFCGAGGLSWGMHNNPYFKTMVAWILMRKLLLHLKIICQIR